MGRPRKSGSGGSCMEKVPAPMRRLMAQRDDASDRKDEDIRTAFKFLAETMYRVVECVEEGRIHSVERIVQKEHDRIHSAIELADIHH